MRNVSQQRCPASWPTCAANQKRDEDLVGRLGGDEFVIMLPHSSGSRATTVAQHVLAALSSPFQIDSLDVSISSSIGISNFPQHGSDVDMLIHAADLAIYPAKQVGWASYHIYTPMLRDRGCTTNQ